MDVHGQTRERDKQTNDVLSAQSNIRRVLEVAGGGGLYEYMHMAWNMSYTTHYTLPSNKEHVDGWYYDTGTGYFTPGSAR